MWTDGWGHHAMMTGFDGSWGLMMGFHWIFWLLVIGLVFYVVYSVAKHLSRDRTEQTALSTAAQRFASGEIDRDQYLAIKKELTS